MKRITEARYEKDGRLGRWSTEPVEIKEMFDSGLDLVTMFEAETEWNLAYSKDLIGETVMIGEEEYVVEESEQWVEGEQNYEDIWCRT